MPDINTLADSQNTTRAEADYISRLNMEMRRASAQTILRTAIIREWPGELAYVSSFGAESAVMLGLIADIDPGLPVIFLDTGMHFPQTLQYRDVLIARLGLTDVQIFEPDVDERLSRDPGNDLWKHDADACCNLRKTRPLDPALKGFSAWITGRKRFHGGTRLQLPVVERNATHFKINPLASWGAEDINAFFEARQLPPHPLVSQGYMSIGCWPCTAPTRDLSDVRSGRWSGQDKSECGLHVEKSERPRVF